MADAARRSPLSLLDPSVRAEAARVAGTLAGIGVGLGAAAAGAADVAGAGWAAAYALGGWDGVRAGWEALRERRADIDLLMVLAALGALAIGAPFEGALLLFLFSLSNVLQHVALGRSRRAVEALMDLRPETARVRRGGAWAETAVGAVVVGEVVLVTPGDRLPLDGVVVDGRSDVDQASLTGESVPVTKTPGDEVFAGTIAGGGTLEIRVTRPEAESALARMTRLVEEAQAQRAETQRLIDRFEQPYVLGVLAMTAVAAALPVLGWGEPTSVAIYRAMTLMVAASPCALVISTPAAVLSAIAAAARIGVLFKGGVAVEDAARVRAVAFDKTGTLTAGQTRLTDALPLSDLSADALVALAAVVQARSEHHLAKATLRDAEARGLAVPEAEGFTAVPGRGVEARVGGRTVRIGNPGYLSERAVAGLPVALAEVDRLRALARTAVVVSVADADGERAAGVLAFADTVRPGARAAVDRLRASGVEHVVILTGDARPVAEAVAAAVGADAVMAELLPDEKVAAVRALEAQWGGLAMVGDGVNDAPALAAATLGIAMGGAGTDVALETADVVLMADDLGKVAYALGLGRRARRTLAVNLVIAVGAMAVMVASILLVGLPLPLAVVGHEGSTVVVSLNGLRLLAARDAA